MPELPLWMEVLYVIGMAELVFIWLACAAFVILYRPWRPWKHGRAGTHLLATSHTILGLVTLSLVEILFDLPDDVWLVLQVVILTALSYAMATRVGLFLSVNRQGKSYEPREDATLEGNSPTRKP